MPYTPIEEIIGTDFDRSSYPVRDFPSGKFRYSINIFPVQLDFSEITNGEESLDQTIILINNGYDDILINDIEVVGEFSLNSVKPTEIKAGEQVSLDISFKPTGITGATSGGLYVNAPDVVGNHFIKFIGSGI